MAQVFDFHARRGGEGMESWLSGRWIPDSTAEETCLLMEATEFYSKLWART